VYVRIEYVAHSYVQLRPIERFAIDFLETLNRPDVEEKMLASQVCAGT